MKNQLNPNHLGNDVDFEVQPPNGTLTVSDFPFHKLADPNVAGDPACAAPLNATINAGVLENNFPGGVTDKTVCAASNVVRDVNDVASSMGVVFSKFSDIPAPRSGGA